MKLLTTSEARCYRACDMKHHIRYERLIRAREEKADSLRFGTLTHSWLEPWWLAPEGCRLEAALAVINGAECDPVDRAISRVLALVYDARWRDAGLETIAVETEFRAPLRNPITQAASRTWEFGGKLDAIVRETSTGRLLIVEHKTSSDDISQGSDYWKLLLIDDQVSNYFQGARSLGYEPDACLYDVIKKPKMRPLQATPIEDRKYTKAGTLYASQREHDEPIEDFEARLKAKILEAPWEWFQRGEVARVEEAELTAAYDLWSTAKQIQESHVAQRHPRNPQSCRDYYRFCEYFGVCTSTESLDDERLFEQVASPHEELSQGSQPAE